MKRYRDGKEFPMAHQHSYFAIRVSTLGLHLLIPEHGNSKTNVIELMVNRIAQFGTRPASQLSTVTTVSPKMASTVVAPDNCEPQNHVHSCRARQLWAPKSRPQLSEAITVDAAQLSCRSAARPIPFDAMAQWLRWPPLLSARSLVRIPAATFLNYYPQFLPHNRPSKKTAGPS